MLKNRANTVSAVLSFTELIAFSDTLLVAKRRVAVWHASTLLNRYKQMLQDFACSVTGKDTNCEKNCRATRIDERIFTR